MKTGDRFAASSAHVAKPGPARSPWSAPIGVAVTLCAFILYLSTLAPTVLNYRYPSMRDSVALQVKVPLLGIPDSTGYPTYTMLTHLFTYLPVGDVAYRVNLASAAYAALAVAVLFLVCLRLTGRVVPSAAGALLFATSETFWSQAVIAEVYSLNVLFVCLIMLALLVWRAQRPAGRSDRYLLLAAFLTGLSLTHHVTSGLLLPAGLLFVFVVDRRKLSDWRLALKGAVLLAVGLLPYLYLPIRASMAAVREMSSVDSTLVKHDASTLAGFYDLVSGAEFTGAMFVFGLEELPARASFYLQHLLQQFHPAFVAVALVGVGWLLLRDRAALVLLGLLYLGWLVHALEYDIGDVVFYFIPTYLVLAVFVAAGIGALLRTGEVLAGRMGLRRRAVVAILSVPVFLAPLAGVEETYRAVDRSEDYEGRRQIEAVERNVGPNATVLHHRSPLWYMTLVEGRRQDLRLASPFKTTPDRRGLATAAKALESGRVYMLTPGATNPRSYGARRDRLDLIPVVEKVLYEVVPKDRSRASSEE